MKQCISILIIDDHPMTITGYEVCLRDLEDRFDLQINSASNCDMVNKELDLNKDDFYDVVLLDIFLPPSNDGKLISGEDIGLKIRSKYPETKLIVHTYLIDKQRTYSIFKTLDPEGFLEKNCIIPKVLVEAVQNVIDGRRYYTKNISNRLQGMDQDELFIDWLDRKILYYLSIGEKMKNLPEHIPLSMASIERRKRKIKLLLGVSDGNNRDLLERGKELGFI